MLIPLARFKTEKHSLCFLLRRGVELDPCRAEDAENSFVSFTTCTDKRQNPACVLKLVGSKEGPHNGGVGGGMSNYACASV